MGSREHWNRVYQKNASTRLSWFEESPEISLRLIEASGLSPATRLIDIGGGESRLLDALLARGIRSMTVLDISSAAIARAKDRLGPAANRVNWLEADVVDEWHDVPVDIWHDRAAFHFLVSDADRKKYLDHLRNSVVPGGTAIIATFALDGPPMCSGLPVARYSPETLAAAIGHDFELCESISHLHRTPVGALQSFQYSRFVRRVGSTPNL